MMKVRKFRKSDAEQVSKMMEEIISNDKNLKKKEKEIILNRTKSENIKKRSKIIDYFVAEKYGKKIIGICGLKKNEIINMYSHPEYKNKGIGTKVLVTVSRYAKKKKIKKLFLYTGRPKAVKFYQKNDFKIIRKFKDKGKNIFYMEKKLK